MNHIYDSDDDDEIDNVGVVPEEQYHTAITTYNSKKINNLELLLVMNTMIPL